MPTYKSLKKKWLQTLLNPLKEKNEQLRKDIVGFRMAVCEACGWTERTYYNKISGESPLFKDEEEKIINIFTSPHWAERVELPIELN